VTAQVASVTTNSLPAPIRATAWGAVFLLALMLFSSAVMKTVFSPLQEAAKLDMHLSDFAISLVQGLATGAPVALASIPLAWVIDHGHRVRLLIYLLLTCVVGTFMTAFAGGLTVLFIARMLSALGATCAIAVVISLTADMCAPERRGRAVVVIGMGAYAGTAAAFAIGGLLFARLGAHPLAWLGGISPWRGTHLLTGLFGALLLAPLFFLREPERHEVEVKDTAFGPTLRALWSKRRFLTPLFVGQIGVTMADAAAVIWATPVLIRSYHLQLAQFSGWVGGIIFIGSVFGSVLGGFGADFGHKSGRRGGLLFAAIISTAIGIPAAIFPIMPTVPGFAAMFFLLVLSGTMTSVVATTAIAVLIPNEERGACLAAFGVINSIIGATLAPTIVTLGSWAMGGEQHLAMSLAITGGVTGVISCAGYIVAMRNAPLSATHPGWAPEGTASAS
jgi:MFS family permease